MSDEEFKCLLDEEETVYDFEKFVKLEIIIKIDEPNDFLSKLANKKAQPSLVLRQNSNADSFYNFDKEKPNFESEYSSLQDGRSMQKFRNNFRIRTT